MLRRTGWHAVGLLVFTLVALAADGVPAAGPADRLVPGPADPLFPLVPPESSVTLIVEDLRGQARAFFESPLAARLDLWPPFRAWRASDSIRKFQQALRKIEVVTGEKVSVLRDDLLGEAVVLSMVLPGEGEPAEARGLLLTRVRDRKLLGRFLGAIDAAQLQSGELARVRSATEQGTSFRVREYRDARRLAESYATLDDGTFAWSNSESLIRGVIQRHGGKPGGLAGDPTFWALRQRLPRRAALSVYIARQTVARLLSSTASGRKAGDDRLSGLLSRYVGALDGFAAAVELRDGIILQTEEQLDPEKLDPWIRRWAARSPGGSPGFGASVPAKALAAGSFLVDFRSLLDAVVALTPETDGDRVALLRILLKGVLLGHDPRDEIAPRLGPVVRFTIEGPTAGAGLARFPVVALVEIEKQKDQEREAFDVAGSIENGLRSLLAAYALDAKRGGEPSRWASKPIEGVIVQGLEPRSPFQFAVFEGRLVLGNEAEAIVRGVRPLSGGAASPPFEDWRRLYFPTAGSFVGVDLQAVQRAVEQHRGSLIHALASRPQVAPDRLGRNLDRLGSLGAIFRGAFVTSTIQEDATAIRRQLGLITRESPP